MPAPPRDLCLMTTRKPLAFPSLGRKTGVLMRLIETRQLILDRSNGEICVLGCMDKFQRIWRAGVHKLDMAREGLIAHIEEVPEAIMTELNGLPCRAESTPHSTDMLVFFLPADCALEHAVAWTSGGKTYATWESSPTLVVPAAETLDPPYSLMAHFGSFARIARVGPSTIAAVGKGFEVLLSAYMPQYLADRMYDKWGDAWGERWWPHPDPSDVDPSYHARMMEQALGRPKPTFMIEAKCMTPFKVTRPPDLTKWRRSPSSMPMGLKKAHVWVDGYNEDGLDPRHYGVAHYFSINGPSEDGDDGPVSVQIQMS